MAILEDLEILFALARYFLGTGREVIPRILCKALRRFLPSCFRPRLKPRGENEYVVRTFTGDVSFGGTDSFISVLLVDEDGTESDWHSLRDSTVSTFYRNSVDEFRFSEKILKRIRVVVFKNEGGGIGETWMLNKAQVETIKKVNIDGKLVDQLVVADFPVFSWIEVNDTRAFFDSQSTSKEDTPELLRSYRTQELQRAQTLYQYEIYNNLSSGLMRRPDLKNYMRRLAGTDASLPMDERFSNTKSKGFALNVIAGLIPRTIMNILNSSASNTQGTSLHNLSWTKYYHLKQAFWLMGLWYYYIPAISKRWKEDLEFGRLRLAGVNPVFIHKLLPDDGILEAAKITDDTVRGLLPQGATLKTETLKSKVYYVSYRSILNEEWRAKFNVNGRYVTSPIALFHVNDQKQLVPLAIQLEQNQVPFTPHDKPEDWILAKIHFSAADSGVHQLYTHYTRAHAGTEVFSIATRRQLFHAHPVYKLIKPHLRYTIAINSKAREKLINAGGHVENAFFTGANTMQFAEFAYQQIYKFDSQPLPKDLKIRGVNNDQALPFYPYRDDGLEIWGAIHWMVKSYLKIYYTQEDVVGVDKKRLNRQILGDTELQAWYTDAVTNGIKTSKPLNNLKRLVNVITTLIWVATAHHACVNFNQYEITSYGLVAPPHCRLPPFQKGEGSEERVMSTIPDLMTNCLVISVTKTLSSYAAKGEEEYLGTTKEKLVYDREAVEVLEQFNQRLKRVEASIKARDKERVAVYGVNYPYLLPSKIANSVAI